MPVWLRTVLIRVSVRSTFVRAGMIALCLAWVSGSVIAQAPLSDPTAPLYRSGSAGNAARPLWQLQSTLIGSQRRVAIINGQVVTEGSAVDGARVVAIDRYAVLLDLGGRRLQLRLFGAGPASEQELSGNP